MQYIKLKDGSFKSYLDSASIKIIDDRIHIDDEHCKDGTLMLVDIAQLNTKQYRMKLYGSPEPVIRDGEVDS